MGDRPTDRTENASYRTTDLSQVRSAPPTCRRTPRYQGDKHGERHDGMAKGATAWGHVGNLPNPTSLQEPAADPNGTTPSSPGLPHSNIRPSKLNHESLLIRTSSTLCRRDCEAGDLAHMGLDQQRLTQHTRRRDASTRQAPEKSLSYLNGVEIKLRLTLV
ncbi:hypothetical protein B296_00030988 [Ensete ventricosum]|uniref:Uncharacterized protein n=1 Tax=Ensete ventricosum TaxID=4639 RepID=A0A427AHH8_ENSVE|nr:hypothetical protein B296_00030988 [Ensete ventricosum]